MAEYFTVFLVGFATVFVAGFQSRNVNSGNFGWAATTAFAMGFTQSKLWTLVTSHPTALTSLIYGSSGAAGIVACMWFHRRFIQK
jgi:hypothetical protein